MTLYDAHRAGGSCVRPQVLGLASTESSIWREPGPGHRRTGDGGPGGLPVVVHLRPFYRVPGAAGSPIASTGRDAAYLRSAWDHSWCETGRL
jgi:hypothetical protein